MCHVVSSPPRSPFVWRRGSLRREDSACLVQDISNEAPLRARTEIPRTGTQNRHTCGKGMRCPGMQAYAATFFASRTKISGFRVKQKMHLRTFDDDGEIACRRIAADIKDQSSSVNHLTDKEKHSTLRRVRGQRNTEWEETTYESCSDKVAPERHAPRRRGYNARRLRAVTTAYGHSRAWPCIPCG